MTPILLKGGRLIDPACALDGPFDLLLSNGIVQAVEAPGALDAARDAQVVDAVRYWVVPGLIDPHVHLRDPGFPEKETIPTGLRAAVAGGFTTVAAMANTLPADDTPEIARYMLGRAREARAARLIPVGAVTRGLHGAQLVDYGAMAEAGARLFSDDGIPIDDQAVLARALKEVSRLDFVISLHEEDRAISASGAINAGETADLLGLRGIPGDAESIRVRRDLALALGSEAAVHLAHVSTAQSLDLIRAARKRGAVVTCEVTPHHFALDERVVLESGPNAKMSPPLRNHQEQVAIIAAMADGTIDMIATDHAPHDPASKEMERLAGFFGPGIKSGRLPEEQACALTRAANGVVGLETALGLAMGLVRRSVISATRMVEMMSLNPAGLLRLKAGTLAPGATADVTVIDPQRAWRVDPRRFLSKSRNTPFAGMELRGRAILTIVGGLIVYDGRIGAA